MSFKESVLIPLSEYNKLIKCNKEKLSNLPINESQNIAKEFSRGTIFDNDFPSDLKMMLFDQETMKRKNVHPPRLDDSKKYDNLVHFLTEKRQTLANELLTFLEKFSSILSFDANRNIVIDGISRENTDIRKIIFYLMLYESPPITKPLPNYLIEFYEKVINLGYPKSKIPADGWIPLMIENKKNPPVHQSKTKAPSPNVNPENMNVTIKHKRKLKRLQNQSNKPRFIVTRSKKRVLRSGKEIKQKGTGKVDIEQPIIVWLKY